MNPSLVFFPLLFSVVFVIAGCDRDDTDDRNKFTGRYEVEEQSLEMHASRDNYEVRIRKDPDSDNLVIICNFYNNEVEVFADIDGNAMHVPHQVIGVYEFEGEGTLTGSVIVLDYTVASVAAGGGFFDRLRARMTLIE